MKSDQFKPITSNKISPTSSIGIKQARPSSQQTSVLTQAVSDIFSSSPSSDEMSADNLSFNFSQSKKINEKENYQMQSSAPKQQKHKIDFDFKEKALEVETNEMNECQRYFSDFKIS